MNNKLFDRVVSDTLNDKHKALVNFNKYMLARTQSMFTYKNLPDTVPQRILEQYLQMNGNCIFAKVNDDYYVFTGSYGGELNEYYEPTLYTVSNPYLNISKEYKIDEDCVLFKNDSYEMGLVPVFNKYGVLLVENLISMKVATINSRILNCISASDDKTKSSAELYLKHIVDGDVSVIGENSFFDGVKIQGTTPTNNYLSQYVELHQYLKASCFNEIGLNANYNMKREAINSNESALNNDFLLPFIDDMMKNRKEAIEKINEMFGMNIEIDYASSWETTLKQDNHEKIIADSVPNNVGEEFSDTGNTPTEVENTDTVGVDNKEPETPVEGADNKEPVEGVDNKEPETPVEGADNKEPVS